MKSGSLKLLWRGALGGAAGGLLWVLLLASFRRRDAYTLNAFFLTALFVVPVSAAVGTAAGWVVAELHAVTKKSYGLLMRAVIGMVCAVVVAAIVWSFVNMIKTGEEPIAWRIKYWLSFSIIVGVLAGWMIGNQSASE